MVEYPSMMNHGNSALNPDEPSHHIGCPAIRFLPTANLVATAPDILAQIQKIARALRGDSKPPASLKQLIYTDSTHQTCEEKALMKVLLESQWNMDSRVDHDPWSRPTQGMASPFYRPTSHTVRLQAELIETVAAGGTLQGPALDMPLLMQAGKLTKETGAESRVEKAVVAFYNMMEHWWRHPNLGIDHVTLAYSRNHLFVLVAVNDRLAPGTPYYILDPWEGDVYKAHPQTDSLHFPIMSRTEFFNLDDYQRYQAQIKVSQQHTPSLFTGSPTP